MNACHGLPGPSRPFPVHPEPFGAQGTLFVSLCSIPTAMRITATFLIASLLLLGSCTEKENATPRPPIGQEDLLGQEFQFKVKADEWVVNGTPGDDTFGYMAVGDVNIITEEIASNGVVRVSVKRANNNWSELPLQAQQGAPGGVNWRFTYRTNLVQVIIDRNGESFSPPDELMVFKVVAFADQGLASSPEAE